MYTKVYSMEQWKPMYPSLKFIIINSWLILFHYAPTYIFYPMCFKKISYHIILSFVILAYISKFGFLKTQPYAIIAPKIIIPYSNWVSNICSNANYFHLLDSEATLGHMMCFKLLLTYKSPHSISFLVVHCWKDIRFVL